MSLIRLSPLTKHNWKACAELSVSKDQIDFVPANLYSIAEAQFYPDACPLAIYNESDVLVGFVLYGRDDSSGKWKIFRLMIDAAHQRRGYARATMSLLLATLSRKADGQEILIAYQSVNDVARELYRSMGFVELSSTNGVTTAAYRQR